MWETVMKAGMTTANLMWCVGVTVVLLFADSASRPGPIKTTSGATPTYMVPWKVDPQNFFYVSQFMTFVGPSSVRE